MNRQFFTLTLQSAKDIAPNTKHFVFLSSRPISFLPGQFIMLYLQGDNKALRRSYSLANQPEEGLTQELELAASYVPKGVASERLFTMQPGDTIEATGPFGRLVLGNESVKRYFLVATGTGVTPYRAMLTELARRMNVQKELRVMLLFGVRQPQDVLYREEFIKFAEQNNRFEFHVYYSRAATPTLPYEYYGYVTKGLANIVNVVPGEDIVYLCGNPNMVDDARYLLIKKGLTYDKIRLEKYVS